MELIYRPIVGEVKQQIDRGNVVILIGARQVGKTSILKLLMEEVKRESAFRVFYFDLEKEEILEIFQSYRTLIDWLKLQGARLEEVNYLLIDEFHYIPNPTRLFKIIHDDFPNLKVVASGSSSLEISSKIKEASTGRKRIFKVYPLDFAEFLEFKRSSQRDIYQRIIKEPRLKLVEPLLSELAKEWEEFLLFGGYPKVVLRLGEEEKATELEEIYNSYVQKDIKAFLKIENVLAFNKLIKILAVQIGNLANLSEIGSPLKIARETLERYVFVLENTFIIKTLPPFFSNKNKEITKMGKVFFYDTGLRNFSIKDFKELTLRVDRGALAENAVASELLKAASIFQDLHFWRTQAKTEVDFILADKADIIPIEVKYQTLKAPKVPSGLKAFIENYKPAKAYVLTRNFTGKVNFRDCEIKFLPAFMCSAVRSL